MTVTPREFHATAGADWRLVGQTACTHLRTGSLAAGAQLAQAIGALDGIDDFHPATDVRRDGVTVRVFTFLSGGLSARHGELARRISSVAHELGVSADPSAVQNLVVSVDALAIADVLPFWRAVLGYRPRADTPDEELYDPHLRWPVFYFNQLDAPRPQRNRLHIDVWVPHDQAEARVSAAIAAGGRLVDDRDAPEWWVLADAEGNEACVASRPDLD